MSDYKPILLYIHITYIDHRDDEGRPYWVTEFSGKVSVQGSALLVLQPFVLVSSLLPAHRDDEGRH